jgi:hypothetical protein
MKKKKMRKKKKKRASGKKTGVRNYEGIGLASGVVII